MTLLAHLTSLDVPTLAVAFAAGLAVGAGIAAALVGRSSR